MNKKENYIRACLFQRPEYIPVNFSINASCINTYDLDWLDVLLDQHKILFPGYQKGNIKESKGRLPPWRRAGTHHVDSWGCKWETKTNGITGSVIKHPLKDLRRLESFVPPDPGIHNGWGEINWDKIKAEAARAKLNNNLFVGSLRHGFFLLTLEYLRGFEELIYDMTDESNELLKLLQIVEDFNMGLVTRFLELKPDIMHYPEDLGMQDRLMLSPPLFRKYIKPTYKRLMEPSKQCGSIIHMHSDGHIMEIIEDLLECGVQVINLQDLVNGIDEIAKNIKRKMCVDLDIDRQNVTRYGSPADVRDLIKEEVIKLGDTSGGLMLKHDLYPGIPEKNIESLMDAMEEFMFCYK